MRKLARGLALAALFGALLGLPTGAQAFGPLSSFGTFSEAGEAGSFYEPAGLAIAADGRAYVGDPGRNRISVFSPAGDFLFAFGKGVNAGEGDPDVCSTQCQPGVIVGDGGALYGAQRLALDAAGNVYVAEWGGDRISVFDSEGSFLYTFGWEVLEEDSEQLEVCEVAAECRGGRGADEAGGIYEPAGIEVDDAGLLYVASGGNKRIEVFTTSGEFVRAFGKGVNPSGEGDPDICTAATECVAGEASGGAGAIGYPSGLAIGPEGELAVADGGTPDPSYPEGGNLRVDVFTTSGEFVRAFGKGVNPSGEGDPDVCTTETGCQAGNAVAGEEAGGLHKPISLATSPAGTLYVADRQLNRVAEFGFDGSFVRAFGAGVAGNASAFEICTVDPPGCQAGFPATFPGATPEPLGLAFDCRGALYVSERISESFARVERFGEPGTEPAPCAASESDPDPDPDPDPEPESEPAPTADPVVEAAPLPSDRLIDLLGVRLDRSRGTAVLLVRVWQAGKLILHGRGVRRVGQKVGAPGRFRLPVRPNPALARRLNRRGKARIVAKVTFRRKDGTAVTRRRSLVLKRKR